MRLFINGEEKNSSDFLSLAELIEQLGMKGDRVAVELNREIVRQPAWPASEVLDGAQIEVVWFVGGGAH